MKFLPYILVMAVTTYLIRMIPLTVFRKKITSRFILSFLYYVPYAVLSAMTFPAILFGTSSIISAAAGLIAAVVAALLNRSLTTVALSACGAALLVELLLPMIPV
ncbi:MAG: AzlD domain-containing protein [Clostridia bacterium]|nr:AzlD domain-containing protein [Clostridia bacterium]